MERTSLARTACRRCREQKLRCSRELLTCDRCLRLGANCEYPPPPDRKVLAAFRAHPKRKRARTSGSNPPPSSTTQETSQHETQNSAAPASASPSTRAVRPNNDLSLFRQSSSNNIMTIDTDINLSVVVQKFLHDVYFTCMFNSTLVFHRPSFSRAFERGLLPRHLLLAVYASATIFLSPGSVLARQHANMLQPLGDVRALGRKWAILAGKEVLQDIDQPVLESVQTCEMLTLYWFSAGESQRNRTFSGIAYKAACILGFDKDGTSTPSSAEMLHASESTPEWIEAELLRRCFWAVWFTQCINSDHGLQGPSYVDRVMRLPLPIGETSYVQNVQEPLRTMETVMETLSHRHLNQDSPSSPSIMAELMFLMMNWVRIRDLIRSQSRGLPSKEGLADLFELEGQLTSWSARLPECFSYSKRNLYQQLVVDQQPVYIFIHALYHQCRLVLHSSLVPQFGGLLLSHTLPSEVISLSARIALKSAQAISELGADLLALDWDPAQIASFVGYCIYAAASIHITLLYSGNATLAALARANLISSLKLLKSMKIHWANLERLWIRINTLYGAQISRHRMTVQEGVSGSPESPDLDRLARETRHTGQLAEPLADSVLEYTLQRLKPSPNASDQIIHELEQTLQPDDLAHLMTDESAPQEVQPDSSGTAQNQWDTNSFPTAVDQRTGGLSSMPPYTWHSDRTRTPVLPPSQLDGWDWWQLTLDNIQQPVLPSDGFLDLDFGM